jgi:hypothetical protein
MVIAVTGHAYPWDVVGDPAFVERVAALGLTQVSLAAAYHSARAATPLHPRHQLVHAHYAALYRPVREAAWQYRRLRPRRPDWMSAADPFADAAEALRRGGLNVHAWIVLTHNTRIGQIFGELAVTNCFGDRYPYALCPAQEEVREYAARLARESVVDVPLAGVSLEACGQLGLDHNSHHEKTGDAWTPNATRLLSVCCCTACRSAWAARGLDPSEVIGALRTAVGNDGALPEAMAAEILAARHEATDLMRAEVLDVLAQYAPNVPVTLHAQPDPWATGASPGLTGAATKAVDALLVPAWSTAPGTAEVAAAATKTGLPVDAYVTVLPPARPDEVIPHVRRLVAAGASRLSLYHLGLAPRWRQPLLREVVAVAADLG